MQLTTNFDRLFRHDRASAAMGVHRRRDADGEVFVQDMTPHLVDDPTGTSVCTYGVLIDTCVGSAAVRDPLNDQFYVGSRLGVNWVGHITGEGELTAISRLVSRDVSAGTVLAAAEIRQGGILVGQAYCRGVAIGTVESVLGDRVETTSVAAVLGSAGLHDLGLEVTVPKSQDSDRCGQWSPQPWMENGRGDVQGGVVLAVAGEVAERIGSRLAGPDRTATLLDIDVNILRAPAITGTHDLVCRVVRMGRRIGVLEIEVRDGEGCQVFASAQVLLA